MHPSKIIIQDFIDKQPLSAAQVLEGMSTEEIVDFLVELPIEKSLKLLDFINPNKGAECLSLLPHDLAVKILENGELSFADTLCRRLDESVRENILTRLSPERSASLRQKLAQGENTIGMLMEPAIIVNKEMSVKDAVEIIKKNKENLESFLYVVDLNGTFEGAIRLKELIIADRKLSLEELIITKIPTFSAHTPVSDILNHPVWYEYRYIPVVDNDEKLLGTLPYRRTKEITKSDSEFGTKGILETGSALGELYLIGLVGLLRSMGK